METPQPNFEGEPEEPNEGVQMIRAEQKKLIKRVEHTLAAAERIDQEKEGLEIKKQELFRLEETITDRVDALQEELRRSDDPEDRVAVMQQIKILLEQSQKKWQQISECNDDLGIYNEVSDRIEKKQAEINHRDQTFDEILAANPKSN